MGRGSSSRQRLRILTLTAALILLAAAPYLIHGGLRNFILLDDSDYVSGNALVAQGLTLSGILRSFAVFQVGNWQPLTLLSHMLDVSLFGLNAWGHHLTSVLLHTLNTALLFLVLTRLTGAAWASWFAAAFFGAHPLRVESVAWVAERKDVLSGLMFMLVLLAYERYARRRGVARYLLVAALLALGLMAKSMLVTVPFVFLLLDFWPLGRLRPRTPSTRGAGSSRTGSTTLGRLLVEKVPLLVLSGVSGIVTVLAQKAGGAVTELGEIAFGVRLANALSAYLAYIGKTVWPHPLAVYYPHPLTTPPWWKIAGVVLVLLLVTSAAVRWWLRRPCLAVGWFWYVGMLVPVIGLVQVGEQALADRYTYLPGIGLTLILAWGMPVIFRFLRVRPAVIAAGASLMLGVLLVLTALQAGRWKDSETLFRHTLAVTSNNWLIHNNLAGALADKGKFPEAIAQYQEVLAFQPNDFSAHYNLGVVLADMGRFSEAITHDQEALRLRPAKPEAINNMGLALSGVGRLDEAIGHFQRALSIRPDFPEVHNNLGIALDRVGRREEAVQHYREAVRQRPAFPEALFNLGLAYQESGRLDEALNCYRDAIRLRPDLLEVHEQLGKTLLTLGRRQDAEYHLGEARRLRALRSVPL